jgi:UDP-N-acetylmuramate--alanine ligase
MIADLDPYKNIFFIGVAGTGMSALAQFLAGNGKIVSGSDRFFSA